MSKRPGLEVEVDCATGAVNARRAEPFPVASGDQASGATAGCRAAEPRSAMSRSTPPGRNSIAHTVTVSLVFEAVVAWAMNASHAPDGSTLAEPGRISAGRTLSSVVEVAPPSGALALR